MVCVSWQNIKSAMLSPSGSPPDDKIVLLVLFVRVGLNSSGDPDTNCSGWHVRLVVGLNGGRSSWSWGRGMIWAWGRCGGRLGLSYHINDVRWPQGGHRGEGRTAKMTLDHLLKCSITVCDSMHKCSWSYPSWPPSPPPTPLSPGLLQLITSTRLICIFHFFFRIWDFLQALGHSIWYPSKTEQQRECWT